MTRAWAFKELRETVGIAGVGLAVLAMLVTWSTGAVGQFFGMSRPGTIPFLSDSFVGTYAMLIVPLAIALGLRQSVGDFLGGAQLFLFHRPARRIQVFAIKLMVGALLVVVAGGLPILIYALWAATPGTHASPFAWSMTLTAWTTCAAAVLVYCGTFLSGLRPGSWYGTRLAPLAASCCMALLAVLLPNVVAWPGLALCLFGFVVLVLYVAVERDFG